MGGDRTCNSASGSLLVFTDQKAEVRQLLVRHAQEAVAVVISVSLGHGGANALGLGVGYLMIPCRHSRLPSTYKVRAKGMICIKPIDLSTYT